MLQAIFLNALDRSTYSQFLANLENDKATGDAGPVTLNDAFQRAVKFVVPKSNFKIASGAAFLTADSMRGGGKGRGRGGRVIRGGRYGRGHDASRINVTKSTFKNDQSKNEAVGETMEALDHGFMVLFFGQI